MGVWERNAEKNFWRPSPYSPEHVPSAPRPGRRGRRSRPAAATVRPAPPWRAATASPAPPARTALARRHRLACTAGPHRPGAPPPPRLHRRPAPPWRAATASPAPPARTALARRHRLACTAGPHRPVPLPRTADPVRPAPTASHCPRRGPSGPRTPPLAAVPSGPAVSLLHIWITGDPCVICATCRASERPVDARKAPWLQRIRPRPRSRFWWSGGARSSRVARCG